MTVCPACLYPNSIFVFGSNLAGRHGAGAALHAATRHRARAAMYSGHSGTAYAIPTKDERFKTLPLDAIRAEVDTFIKSAGYYDESTYIVTRIGCGLAGYEDREIAPMFAGAPGNCMFDTKWEKWLGDKVKYWGTYDEMKRGQ